MHRYQRLASVLLVAFSLMGLASCAMGPQLNLQQITSIREGQQSAILMAYKPYSSMISARLTFVNVRTSDTYELWVNGANSFVKASPDMVAVPAGRYRILNGTTADGSAFGTLPLIAYWFDEFEVGPGEVVDIGTLNVEDVEVRSMSGIADSVVYTMLTLNPARRDSYLSYSFNNASEADVQRMLGEKYPTLGVVPIRRSPRLILEKARFEQIIRESFTPKSDGSLPTTAEAQARVSASIRQFILDSRAEDGIRARPVQ